MRVDAKIRAAMRKARGHRDAIAARLRDLIAARGKTVARVERDMGRRRGYLADALRGEKRLNVETLFETLEHLGESPMDFFGKALARLPAGEVRERPEDSGQPRATALRLSALVLLLDRRGLVDRDELEALAARLAGESV
jgi:transcriptional regulator with XRE-family HTH domain